jgi:hypothetical protein
MTVTRLIDWRNWLFGVRIGKSAEYGNFLIVQIGPLGFGIFKTKKEAAE